MSNTIELLLMPFSQSDAIAFPKNLVEYVLPYAPPLPSAYTHEALIGSLIYKNNKVPVVDGASLDNPERHTALPEIADGQYRLIIISSIMESSFCENYALMTTNAPRIVEVNADMVKEVQTEVSPMFHSKVRLGTNVSHQYAYLPNVEKIETALFGS